jgi:hypothetical protein
MYILNDKGLFHNGRRIPRMLHFDDAPQGVNQYLLDLLCFYFKDDIDPERRALAIYRKSPDLLATRFVHNETSCISDEELEELIITLLCRCHDEREGYIEYVSGCRRDTLRLQ